MNKLSFIPKLIILDRDGVINKDYPTGCLSKKDFILLPRVIEALRLMNTCGVLTAIATNQALVGRGDISQATLDDIHHYMYEVFKAQNVIVGPLYYCTDTDIEPHFRRKPAPGMLIEAMNDLKCSPHETVFIGDAQRDLEAAHNANCTPILVKTGKGMNTMKNLNPHHKNILVYEDLYDAVKHIFYEIF